MKKNFTLLELLIVISIIMILAAILLPSLTQARKAGQSTVCKNNLKQLAVAMHCYANDYDGWCAYTDGLTTCVDNYLYGPHFNESSYNTSLCPYINYPLVPSSVASSMPPAPLSICPSGRYEGTGPRRSNGNPNFSYSFNVYLCSGTNISYNRSGRITLVKKTSFRLFCVDAQAGAVNIWTNDYFASRHHKAKDNLVFVDGHAESWTPAQKSAVLTGSYSGGYNGFWHDATW